MARLLWGALCNHSRNQIPDVVGELCGEGWSPTVEIGRAGPTLVSGVEPGSQTRVRKGVAARRVPTAGLGRREEQVVTVETERLDARGDVEKLLAERPHW